MSNRMKWAIRFASLLSFPLFGLITVGTARLIYTLAGVAEFPAQDVAAVSTIFTAVAGGATMLTILMWLADV